MGLFGKEEIVPPIVREKVKQVEAMVVSKKINARVDSANNLKYLFTRYDLPTSENLCLCDLNMADLKKGPGYIVSLHHLIKTAVNASGKYLNDTFQIHIKIYKNLFKIFGNRKNALLAMGVGYSWLLGGSGFDRLIDKKGKHKAGLLAGMFGEPEDSTFGNVFTRRITKPFEDIVFDYNSVEEMYDGLSDYVNDDNREQFKYFYYFMQEAKKGRLRIQDFKEEIKKTLHVINEEWDQLCFRQNDPDELYKVMERFDEYRYNLTDEELEDIEKLKNDPNTIFKDHKKYFLIFSRLHLRMFGPNITPVPSEIQHTYDILLLLDKSVIKSPVMHKHCVWADIVLGRSERIQKGLLGIVCIVSNKSLYNEVTKKMLKYTKNKPELRVPIFDPHFKKVWPK